MLQSTAVPGVPLLQASGKSASGKPVAASLMHTMAPVTVDNWISCHARSADTCGLREFHPCSALPSPTRATSTLGGSCPRTAHLMATLALRLARSCCSRGSSPSRTFSKMGQPHLLRHKGKPPSQPAGGPMASPMRPSGFSCPRAHEPDVRDTLPTATGLLPFIVHEAHCQQAKQKDKLAWKRAHDAHQAAPWGLTGYFLDPDLFQMLAHSARPYTSQAGGRRDASPSICS